MGHPTSPEHSPGLDEFNFGVWINSHHVIALGGLNPLLGMRLAVQLLLNEEIASLLQVEATVVTHEALGVVELVPSLDDGAPGRDQESSSEVEKQRARTAFPAASSKTVSGGKQHAGTCQGVIRGSQPTQSCHLTPGVASLCFCREGCSTPSSTAPQLGEKHRLEYLHAACI